MERLPSHRVSGAFGALLVWIAAGSSCGGPDDAPVEEGRRHDFISKHPLAEIQYHGGRVLELPRIVGVFFAGDELQESTEALLQSYGRTPDWREAVAEYGIGDAVHERTVVLSAWPAWDSLEVFRSWVRDRLEAGAFGGVSESHVLMFFLPPLGPDDCTDVVGGHGSVTITGGRRIAFSYTFKCPGSGLATRTLNATRALIDVATDPDPDRPAWRTLGPGLGAPSVRLTGDGEGADLCSAVLRPSIDYPFVVARNYSNRLARAGRDPCDPTTPLRAIAALRATPPAVDLSAGKAHVVVDVFAENPQQPLTVEAGMWIWLEGGGGFGTTLLEDSSTIARDGDVLPLDLRLSLAPGEIADRAKRHEVEITLCDTVLCTPWRFAVSAMPPNPTP